MPLTLYPVHLHPHLFPPIHRLLLLLLALATHPPASPTRCSVSSPDDVVSKVSFGISRCGRWGCRVWGRAFRLWYSKRMWWRSGMLLRGGRLRRLWRAWWCVFCLMLGPWVVSDAGFWSDGGGAYHFDVSDAISECLTDWNQEGAMRQGVVESAMRQMEGAMVKKSRQASTFSKIFDIDGGGGSCSKLFPRLCWRHHPGIESPSWRQVWRHASGVWADLKWWLAAFGVLRLTFRFRRYLHSSKAADPPTLAGIRQTQKMLSPTTILSLCSIFHWFLSHQQSIPIMSKSAPQRKRPKATAKHCKIVIQTTWPFQLVRSKRRQRKPREPHERQVDGQGELDLRLKSAK